MKTSCHTLRAVPPALLAAACLAALPAAALAADAGGYSEADRRELEDRLRQDEFQRQMDDRVRTQEEALRGQERAIRRLEEARTRLEQNSQEVARLSTQLGRDALVTYGTVGAVPLTLPRSVLGVLLDSGAGRSDGALVREVSPGGAAAEAGIRAGDLIVSLKGEDLARGGDPARQLVEKMGQIAPDTKVQVGVLRDGKRMNFDVTARAPVPAVQANGVWGNTMRNLQMVTPQGGMVRVEPSAGVTETLEMLAGSNRLGGMEFATMSEGLGKYFGVKSGVLVVRAGASAPFSLRDGDVILAIDGREPANAQHVGRILRSYQPGEKVKLRVQRDGKPIDLDTTGAGRTR